MAQHSSADSRSALLERSDALPVAALPVAALAVAALPVAAVLPLQLAAAK